MTCLGVDIALLSGYGLVERQGECLYTVDHGIVRIRGLEGPGRFHNAYEAYTSLLEEHKPDLVCAELVNFSRFRLAYRSFCSLRSILLLVCAQQGIPFAEVDTTTLKGYWTGDKRASKALMCATTRELTGISLYSKEEDPGAPKGDEDQADAIAAAHWGAENVLNSQT